MNKDNLIEFAKEQCEIFPENSAMGKYLRATLKMLQAEPCEDAISRQAVLAVAGDSCLDLNDYEDTKEFCDEINELPPAEHGCLHCQGKWIPVSERLPKLYTYVNATCRSLVDNREDWVVETLYLPIPKENNEQGYSDWGNIPMLNWHKAEVIAWMERKIPEPYKEEKKCCSNCKHHTDGEEIHGVTPCGSCDIDKKNFEKDKRKEEHI